jgi:hypothetical protein
VLHQLVHPDRRQRHPVLPVLHFLGYADLHALLLGVVVCVWGVTRVNMW